MTFKIITLGCKVNAYESNVMADILLNNGYKYSDNPDIYIVNTCSVTNNADNKALSKIRSIIKNKQNSILIVTGCIPQTNLNKIDLNEIDILFGNYNKTKILDYINDFLTNKKRIVDIKDISNVSFEHMQILDSNKTRAFVKIEDGCDNYCSYCVIPYARGNVRSKSKIDVLDEVNNLVKKGHKEIILTGIHTGRYNDSGYELKDLLKDLTKIEGLERIRISSIEMNEINTDILELMKTSEKIVDHLHIPLQAGSNEILKSMNRKYTKEEYINKINEIRSIRPSISITTDIIVGFPGETEGYFNETYNLANELKFSKIHVFPYSKRDGTVASSMKNQISNEEKKIRVSKLIRLSEMLEVNYMNRYINSELNVIFETLKDGYLIGHSDNYLEVRVKYDTILNEITKVKITKINYPYLEGEVIDFS